MITGTLKSQVDKIWEAFWTGGVANPITVIEQFTYLIFLRRLDEQQQLEEKKVAMLGIPLREPIYTPVQRGLRWHVFRELDPRAMCDRFTQPQEAHDHLAVFEHMKRLGSRGGAFAEYMQGATFIIPTVRLEHIRHELRELVQYLDASGRVHVYTNLMDWELESEALQEPVYAASNPLYLRRVEDFIRQHAHHITVTKLRTNQPITADELNELQHLIFDGGERGTYEQFRAICGDEPLSKFVRSIVGLDAKTANDLLAEFSLIGPLTATQQHFLQKIVDYLTRNGTIDKGMLCERPFTDLNDQGVFGLFDDAQVARIVSLIDGVNEGAEVG